MLKRFLRFFLAATAFLALLLSPAQGLAQGAINMPYSVFGLGELRHNQYVQNLGMGSLSQGYRSNLSINDVNPASYAALDSTSFVFETTLFTHFYEQKAGDVRQQADYITLGNISLGFPVTRWWSFAAGLKPYSQVGYRIRDVEEHPQAGMVNYIYEGSGGINQLFVGSSVEPLRGLSVGANLNYLFGTLAYEASVRSDSTGVFQTNLTNANQVSGWTLGLGIQYHHRFGQYRHITVGATYGGAQEIGLKTTETLRRRLLGEPNYDTIAHVEMDEGRLSLPAYHGFGVYGRLSRSWFAGLDYQWQNWEDFSFPGKPDAFNNSFRLAGGVRYRPVVETFPTFFHRMQYSVGARYGQSYFMPAGEELREFGISFGTSIPIRGSLSALNIQFEYSRRGSANTHPMEESFYRINVGINIYERWFVRRVFL